MLGQEFGRALAVNVTGGVESSDHFQNDQQTTENAVGIGDSRPQLRRERLRI
jgi:hypothetical protein